MADAVNKIRWDFLLNDRQFQQGMKRTKKSLTTTEKASKAMQSTFGKLGLAIGAVQLTRFAGDAIQLAVAADEVDSKFEAVFGSATALNDSLREWGDLAGVTETRGRDLAATFGNLALAQGLSKQETKEMTILVAELAGDMASFNDQDPERVFEDLNKAILTTEREGMKKYGIALTETEIKQRALAIATKDGRTEFTKGDKALASYQLTVEQAGKAIGDLERTSDSAANVQRQLSASMRETQEEIGKQLLPAYARTLKAVEKLSGPAGDLAVLFADQVGDTADFATSLDGLTDSTISAEKRAGDFVATWLRWFTSGIADDLADSWDSLGEKVERMGDETRTVAEVIESRMNPAAVEAQRVLEGFAGAVDDLTDAERLQIEMSDLLKARFDTLIGRASELADKFQQAGRANPFGGAVIPGPNITTQQPGFATGGTVPGPLGSPQLAVVHGGEKVLTKGQQNGGGGLNLTVNFNGIVGDPTEVAEQLTDLLEQYSRTNFRF